ncbi:MAG: hypothetical protein LRY54_03455 [Alphaproteobacteria bacterium]|nr:hypothetical protein [Alphaproteobacteria bacterium]
MNEIIRLENYRNRPTNHFGQAAELCENEATLVLPKDSFDASLGGGFKINDINEIFELQWNRKHTARDHMFVHLCHLMGEAEESHEARTRLLAVVIGLTEKALDNIRELDLGIRQHQVPKGAILRFTEFADMIRSQHSGHNNYGQPRQRNAEVLAFEPCFAVEG